VFDAMVSYAVRAPGRNAPLIPFLNSALYIILFACLYRINVKKRSNKNLKNVKNVKRDKN